MTGVQTCALPISAIPVAAELGEDDILVAVVKRPGYDVTASEIATWCRERLAPMKVPRYVVFVEELPHTPTHKIAKTSLRADKTLIERATDLAKRAGAGLVKR
mgnify:CR=1 FL=1